MSYSDWSQEQQMRSSVYDAGPMPQQIARYFPFTIVFRTAMDSLLRVLGFGLVWMLTRLMTRHATQSLVLVGLLHFSLDRLVLSLLENEHRRKMYRNKNPYYRLAFFYVVSILICRFIGGLLFGAENDYVPWLEYAANLTRYSLITGIGSLIVGAPYMPFKPVAYMRASSFPLLRNPYQQFIPLLAELVPDDERIQSHRRFLSPSLFSILGRSALTSIVAGVFLGVLYNWKDPTFLMIWAAPFFVESLFMSTRSELCPNSFRPTFPWLDNFHLGTRLITILLLSIFLLPGVEAFCIYSAVFAGTWWTEALIREALFDQCFEPLQFMIWNATIEKETFVLLCCILEDKAIAQEAAKLQSYSADFRKCFPLEVGLYNKLSGQYAHALERASTLANNDLSDDLLKLAALKETDLFTDEVFPQFLRAVCIFIGGLGLHLSECERKARTRRLVVWHLPPSFFVAVSYGLQAIRSKLSTQRPDLLVLAPVALSAIHHLMEGMNDFTEHDKSAAEPLSGLKTMCENTARDILRATMDYFAGTAITVNNFLNVATRTWIASLGVVEAR